MHPKWNQRAIGLIEISLMVFLCKQSDVFCWESSVTYREQPEHWEGGSNIYLYGATDVLWEEHTVVDIICVTAWRWCLCFEFDCERMLQHFVSITSNRKQDDAHFFIEINVWSSPIWKTKHPVGHGDANKTIPPLTIKVNVPIIVKRGKVVHSTTCTVYIDR